jgi:diguanylate cyclase (GGDEF)-like protein
MSNSWCTRLHRLTDRVRAWQLLQLPRWLVAFVVGVIAADLAAIGFTARYTVVRPGDLLIFGLLVACGAITVEMTRRGGEAALFVKDVCGVWELPIAILLPPAYALLAPIPRFALSQWRIRKIQPHRRAFSAAIISLSYGSVYLAFHELGRFTPLSLNGSAREAAAWVLAVAACAGLQWLVNYGLLLVAVKGTDPTVSVRQMLCARENVQNDLIEGCVATLVTLGVAISPVTLIFALPFVTLLQRSGRHAQLVNASRIDSKTGLLNAATWRREGTAEVARAVRSGSDLSVALIDIDHFKEVNDEHGHLAGDEVLAAVGRMLRALLREYDVLGRFGGEEFALVLPQTDEAAACGIAERIRGHIESLSVSAHSRLGSEYVSVTVSIGVASLTSAGESLTELLAAADAAMYGAKHAGRNRVRVAGERAALAGELR